MGNASFEQGQTAWPPPAWLSSPPPPPAGGGTSYAVYNCCNAKDGAHFLRVIDTNPGGSVYQDIPISPVMGESNSFSIWARCKQVSECGISVGVYMWALGTQQSQGVGFVVGSTNWQQYIVPLDVSVAGATAIRVQVYVNSAGRHLDLDATGSTVSRW
jgi:predicted membrane protein